MHKVQCHNCKNDVYVAFYFYGEQIVTKESIMDLSQYYEALVNGRAICPSCCKEINKIFYKTISKESIIDTAVGE